MKKYFFGLASIALGLSNCTLSPTGARNHVSEDEFVLHKLEVLKETPGLSKKAREQARADLMSHLSKDARNKACTRGGIGRGIVFDEAFQKDFKTGTALQYDIIVPAKAGGNVSTWLYLTTTNRAKRGVEAFLSYNGATAAPEFKVFDWARPETEHWQVATPYTTLKSKNWIFQQSYKGKSYDVVRIRSLTYQVSAADWQNDVLLYSKKSGLWAKVYTYRYASTLAEQQSSWWAPIVETFQESYSGTSEFGFLSTAYATRNSGTGGWVPLVWTNLRTKESRQYGPGQGFAILNVDPNYNWTTKAP